MLTSNCDIFIPVRLNSSRLPQKHLQTINGKPALMCLIDRLRKCNEIRHIVVCTTNEKSDDPLIEFLDKEHVRYFRGNEKDILQRFLDAAKSFGTEIIIDVEGDKIYTDPAYVDKIVEIMENGKIDFVIGSNSQSFDPTDHFVHGVIPAGVRVNALEKLCSIKKSNDTETGYKEFFTSSELFTKYYLNPEDVPNESKKIRLTLDYEEDLKLANQIFKEIGDKFTLSDMVRLFNQKPDLIKLTEKLISKWEMNYEKHKTNTSTHDSK